MRRVAQMPASERAALFGETAARAGLGSDLIPEKDFWVCWTLERLYSMDDLPALLFKGGTSLSKCFGLIERFSEDIDIGLDRRGLRIDPEDDPANQGSRSARSKAVKRLTRATNEYIADTLLPRLRDVFSASLGTEADAKIDAANPDTVLFAYPSATPQTGLPAYIAPVVRIELGARSDHFPTERVRIRPYAAEHFPDQFDTPEFEVVAQAPERTLIEKALILHSIEPRPRQSRHAYDLAMMVQRGVLAKVTRDLIEEVARHKLVFADDRKAADAPESGFELVPNEEGLSALRRDYADMQEMFFAEPPAFDDIVGGVRALESALNEIVGLRGG